MICSFRGKKITISEQKNQNYSNKQIRLPKLPVMGSL